jgi:hypothetical protein
MIRKRKGKGKKTFAREKKFFSNIKKGRTPAETLHFKIISMRTRDLKNIVQNNNTEDLLTLSFAKEELDRRNFNQKNKIDTQSKRHNLNKKFPEHKHLSHRSYKR